MLTADDLAFSYRHAADWFAANTWPYDEYAQHDFAEYVQRETEATGELLNISLRSLYNVWRELPEVDNA